MRIAVDAMGGDRAPSCVVEGLALALEEGVASVDHVLLCGRRDALVPLLDEAGLPSVEVVDAPEVVEMTESPSQALRTKRGSSIHVGMQAVVEGRAAAFISAGNTGAVVAAATFILGRLPNVLRPGIAVPMPTRRGPSVVIDMGANIYCKPEHLAQYGIMASEYAKAAFGRQDPTVGLLNIGEEDSKGNPLILEAHARLQRAGINYYGFIEGQDIIGGTVDVVVCEGFVGNVVLKVAEGLGAFVTDQVREAFRERPPREEVAAALDRSFRKLDYAEYGGAPLLGARAPVLIGHGRSEARAVLNMIRVARSATEHDVIRHIVDRLESSRTEALS